MTITSNLGVPFTVEKGRLVEGRSLSGDGISGRNLNLAVLGKILRNYGSTKKRGYSKLRSISVYQGKERVYSVKVDVNTANALSIGCVNFFGDSAKAIRRAALKSSKVIA